MGGAGGGRRLFAERSVIFMSTTHAPPPRAHRSQVSVWVVAVVGIVAALVSALFVGGARSASDASGVIAFARSDGVYVMRADGSGTEGDGSS